MRYVVAVQARVQNECDAGESVGFRVYPTHNRAHELFFFLKCQIAGGAPYRAKSGALVSVLAARLYETEATSDGAAEKLARFGAAKLLTQALAPNLQAA